MSAERRTVGSDLGSRVLVTAVALPVLAAVIIIGKWAVVILATALGVAGLFEYARLIRWRLVLQPPTLTAGVIALVPAMLMAAERSLWAAFLVMAALAIWALGAVLTSPSVSPGWEVAQYQVGALSLGLAWIGVPMICAVQLWRLRHGELLLVDVLAVTFLCDSFAYLGGRLFGQHHPAPTTSPNKTIEGWVIGIVLATLALWGLHYAEGWLSGSQAVVLGSSVAIVGTLGDLVESKLKRLAGVDDSGKLFLAHGGALDRLDSVLPALLVCYVLSVGWIV